MTLILGNYEYEYRYDMGAAVSTMKAALLCLRAYIYILRKRILEVVIVSYKIRTCITVRGVAWRGVVIKFMISWYHYPPNST
jgi:hypothetical protein